MSNIVIIGLLLFLLTVLVPGIVLLIIFSVKKKKRRETPPAVQTPAAQPEVKTPPSSAPRQSLAEALKEQRIRCNMTQEFVAEQLQVSRQAVSKWENGSSDPSTGNLLALAELYGISAGELLRNVQA